MVTWPVHRALVRWLLGENSVADAADTVSVGRAFRRQWHSDSIPAMIPPRSPRRITNVTDGTDLSATRSLWVSSTQPSLASRRAVSISRSIPTAARPRLRERTPSPSAGMRARLALARSPSAATLLLIRAPMAPSPQTLGATAVGTNARASGNISSAFGATSAAANNSATAIGSVSRAAGEQFNGRWLCCRCDRRQVNGSRRGCLCNRREVCLNRSSVKRS